MCLRTLLENLAEQLYDDLEKCAQLLSRAHMSKSPDGLQNGSDLTDYNRCPKATEVE